MQCRPPHHGLVGGVCRFNCHDATELLSALTPASHPCSSAPTPPAVILNSNLNMMLPNLWLWDMVDEFVYQFQSFSQYRCAGWAGRH